ncbi:hypothetical protein HJC99_00490 [Candidatus Saccharibacteria bacterium]|nr:hypothetical protein [Candidatus Saccharibacteria bacterium]
MYKIVRKQEAAVRKISETYEARNYITKDISRSVSLAVNTASGHSERETTDYDRIYYVISGELLINIDGESSGISTGDSLLISKGTIYDFYGTFEAVVVNQPAFGTSVQ